MNNIDEISFSGLYSDLTDFWFGSPKDTAMHASWQFKSENIVTGEDTYPWGGWGEYIDLYE